METIKNKSIVSVSYDDNELVMNNNLSDINVTPRLV